MKKTENIIINISGMSCSACVSKVENKLSSFSEIEKASVNFASEKAIIKLKPEIKIDPIIFVNEIDKLGFKGNLLDNNDIEREKTLKNLKLKLFIGFFLSSILILAMLKNMGLTFLPSFLKNPLFQFIITTPIQFWVGSKFIIGAYKSIKNKFLDMNVLVALGTLSAYIYSVIATFYPSIFFKANIQPNLYYESSALIIMFILIGKYLELVSKDKSNQALKKLLSIKSKSANIIINNIEKKVDINNLKINDVIVIRPGEKVPNDAIIIEGETTINESLITGESLPVKKKKGKNIIGGSINLNGTIKAKITKIGEETFLAKIINLVEEAQATKPKVQQLVDKVTSIFVPVVIVIALSTFIFWYLYNGDFNFALINSIAVLVIACPCSLGLATPTAIIVGVGLASSKGILIKNIDILETINKIDHIVFDKTGTLTYGNPKLNFIYSEESNDLALEIAASLEKYSEHVLGKAILKKASEKKISLSKVDNFKSVTGKGISGRINEKNYFIGNNNFIEENLKITNKKYLSEIESLYNEGQTVVFLSDESEVLAVFGIADSLKENAKTVIDELKKQKYSISLLTGDNEKTAKFFSNKLGINKTISGSLPKDKIEYIKSIQKENKKVIMVGDGINDSPALTQSDISISMGNGTDIAIESSDITLINNDLNSIINTILINKVIIRKIKQNLFWSFIYNFLGIPIAAGLLYPFGILLNPIFAGAAMGLSSISVITNSLLIKRLKFK